MGVRTYKAKQYPPAFVRRAIRLCEEQSDKPYSVVARDLGVEYATLYSWMKRAGKTKLREAPPRASSAAQTPAEMQAEIERLQRELEETRKQLEFAKKAAAFFAQHQK
jgi:transposase